MRERFSSGTICPLRRGKWWERIRSSSVYWQVVLDWHFHEILHAQWVDPAKICISNNLLMTFQFHCSVYVSIHQEESLVMAVGSSLKNPKMGTKHAIWIKIINPFGSHLHTLMRCKHETKRSFMAFGKWIIMLGSSMTVAWRKKISLLEAQRIRCSKRGKKRFLFKSSSYGSGWKRSKMRRDRLLQLLLPLYL